MRSFIIIKPVSCHIPKTIRIFACHDWSGYNGIFSGFSAKAVNSAAWPLSGPVFIRGSSDYFLSQCSPIPRLILIHPFWTFAFSDHVGSILTINRGSRRIHPKPLNGLPVWTAPGLILLAVEWAYICWLIIQASWTPSHPHNFPKPDVEPMFNFPMCLMRQFLKVNIPKRWLHLVLFEESQNNILLRIVNSL